MTAATIRITGYNLPGRSVAPHANVHIGIQRAGEVIEVLPADAEIVEFVVPLEVRAGTDGSPDCFGPFIHGKRGARFVYLNWGDVRDDGAFVGFGRVKLQLSDLAADVTMALVGGGTASAELDLSHPRGGPLFASAPPSNVRWSTNSPDASA